MSPQEEALAEYLGGAKSVIDRVAREMERKAAAGPSQGRRRSLLYPPPTSTTNTAQGSQGASHACPPSPRMAAMHAAHAHGSSCMPPPPSMLSAAQGSSNAAQLRTRARRGSQIISYGSADMATAAGCLPPGLQAAYSSAPPAASCDRDLPSCSVLLESSTTPMVQYSGGSTTRLGSTAGARRNSALGTQAVPGGTLAQGESCPLPYLPSSSMGHQGSISGGSGAHGKQQPSDTCNIPHAISAPLSASITPVAFPPVSSSPKHVVSPGHKRQLPALMATCGSGSESSSTGAHAAQLACAVTATNHRAAGAAGGITGRQHSHHSGVLSPFSAGSASSGRGAGCSEEGAAGSMGGSQGVWAREQSFSEMMARVNMQQAAAAANLGLMDGYGDAEGEVGHGVALYAGGMRVRGPTGSFTQTLPDSTPLSSHASQRLLSPRPSAVPLLAAPGSRADGTSFTGSSSSAGAAQPSRMQRLMGAAKQRLGLARK